MDNIMQKAMRTHPPSEGAVAKSSVGRTPIPATPPSETWMRPGTPSIALGIVGTSSRSLPSKNPLVKLEKID